MGRHATDRVDSTPVAAAAPAAEAAAAAPAAAAAAAAPPPTAEQIATIDPATMMWLTSQHCKGYLQRASKPV